MPFYQVKGGISAHHVQEAQIRIIQRRSYTFILQLTDDVFIRFITDAYLGKDAQGRHAFMGAVETKKTKEQPEFQPYGTLLFNLETKEGELGVPSTLTL